MNATAIETMPNSAPLYFIRFPKKRMKTNEIAGNAGIIHAFSKNHPPAWINDVGPSPANALKATISPFHRIDR